MASFTTTAQSVLGLEPASETTGKSITYSRFKEKLTILGTIFLSIICQTVCALMVVGVTLLTARVIEFGSKQTLELRRFFGLDRGIGIAAGSMY